MIWTHYYERSILKVYRENLISESEISGSKIIAGELEDVKYVKIFLFKLILSSLWKHMSEKLKIIFIQERSLPPGITPPEIKLTNYYFVFFSQN